MVAKAGAAAVSPAINEKYTLLMSHDLDPFNRIDGHIET